MSFADDIEELYQGEVFGEALFDEMLHHLSSDDERLKIAELLQLETETKARLRPLMISLGKSVSSDPNQVQAGRDTAKAIATLPWEVKIATILQTLSEHFLPRFKEIAADARMQPSHLREIADSMVEHETALVEFAKAETRGETNTSLSHVTRLLSHSVCS